MNSSIVANRGFSQKLNNRMANSVDLVETSRCEMYHIDLHCLKRYSCWSAGNTRILHVV